MSNRIQDTQIKSDVQKRKEAMIKEIVDIAIMFYDGLSSAKKGNEAVCESLHEVLKDLRQEALLLFYQNIGKEEFFCFLDFFYSLYDFTNTNCDFVEARLGEIFKKYDRISCGKFKDLCAAMIVRYMFLSL